MGFDGVGRRFGPGDLDLRGIVRGAARDRHLASDDVYGVVSEVLVMIVVLDLL
jgi:hypothetical protein